MRSPSFNKYINSLDHEELKNEIKLLFKKIPSVKEYYKMELGSETERKKLFDKAKEEIKSRYATKSYRRPRKPRIQKINKILSAMKKKSIFQHELVDLYLFDIETCIGFAKNYQLHTQVMQNHMDQVYEKAVQIIEEDQLQEMFKMRVLQIEKWIS